MPKKMTLLFYMATIILMATFFYMIYENRQEIDSNKKRVKENNLLVDENKKIIVLHAKEIEHSKKLITKNSKEIDNSFAYIKASSVGVINFAGIYRHGGCVPVPSCPLESAPSIYAIPISVNGVGGDSPEPLHPITGFSAYAKGGDNATPPKCEGATYAPLCVTSQGISEQKFAPYWRVCLELQTSKGRVGGTAKKDKAWGQYVALLALTRCVKNDEASGSDDSVFSN